MFFHQIIKINTTMPPYNCEQARQIPITEYLDKCGFKPETIKGDNHWYLSPLREEKTPSFKVDCKLNAWYDFGIGEGGNLIDLGIRLKNCSLKTFLADLKIGDYTIQSYEVQDYSTKQLLHDKKVIIHEVADLNTPSLLFYLGKRGISATTAKQWCKEVTFSFGQKQFAAISFENRSGGYELRNHWFKGSSAPKDITFIDNGSKSVCLLEGFIDFLSLLEIKPQGIAGVNFVILNSLSLVSKSIDVLKSHYDIFLFLNHDKAGDISGEKLKAAGIQGVDSSGFYKDFNDINDYLINHLKVHKRDFSMERKGVGRGIGR
jgi:hypothetical protein